MKNLVALFLLAASACFGKNAVEVGTYPQEVRTFYQIKDGLPSDVVYSVAISQEGVVYAGTEKGLVYFVNNAWRPIEQLINVPVRQIVFNGHQLVVLASPAAGSFIAIIENQNTVKEIALPADFSQCVVLAAEDKIYLGNTTGLYLLDYKKKPKQIALGNHAIRQLNFAGENEIVAATDLGLIKFDLKKKTEEALYPHSGSRSWAPRDVQAVFQDGKGHLWFASPQGVGMFDKSWTLYTGKEGLPYNKFTPAAGGANGVVWFGTSKGAIRYHGNHWAYRQGKRWLPDDHVNSIAVNTKGDAWLATNKGLSFIEHKPMTLAEKAKFYEDEIDRYHRRTPYEYVLEVGLPEAGIKANIRKHDSDNDGLWTSMYGAGECFAYAATKDPLAKERATKAFKAMEFLRKVTENAEVSPPHGYVARTILPTDGPNPNDGRLEHDIKNKQTGDKMWKAYEPRWPRSADGKWYYKTDTSSDELDGHYFLYGLYYDLVAETEEEKAAVREQVKALTDHLIKHDFQLVDVDGTPTRWARFSPKEMNYSKNWIIERGLNSLSMLSYLAVARHVTGDEKYGKVMDDLINNHGYMQNLSRQKYQHGIATGNQSDDEMAFMGYYHLVKYEKDPERRSRFAISLWDSWKMEEPEMNPLFNFITAAVCKDVTYTDAFDTQSTEPTGTWHEDAIETLKRIPLDRVDWRHDNSERIDILRPHKSNEAYDERPLARKGYRSNGKVIPADETYYNHWNHDVWALQAGGNGHGLGDGAIYLLPYYMGLYHGFIK
ncbi:MAG: hypothetical protein H6696_04320 [Deferribacteres bacterium]|nr:hypothetical protein [candidate division KSB1 bacterium]MCB9501140.1 hypothetical protein [Deferribacteres bacterium]